jgi:predicted unusual protein kinase regulating ubiquinone biosynthesis (AarF/ABC1/UbiB family)
MVQSLSRLGFIGEGANLAAIERGVGLMMEQYHGMSLGQVRDLSVGEVAHELEDLFYNQPFHVPAQFAFAGRAVGTLSGLATGLAPEFNLVAVAIPYAQKFLGLSPDSVGQSAQQLLTQAVATGRTLMLLPATLERVLTKFEAGQIELRLAEESRNGTGRPARRARRGNSSGSGSGSPLTSLLVALGAFAAGVVLMVNALLIPGWFCLGLAALATVSVLIRR